MRFRKRKEKAAEDGVAPPTLHGDSNQILGAIGTLELHIDAANYHQEKPLSAETRECLRKLNAKIAQLVPSAADRVVPTLEDLTKAEDMNFKCICDDCLAHIPIFQFDLTLSLDFHKQSEVHKSAVKMRELNRALTKEPENNDESKKNNLPAFGEALWKKDRLIDDKTKNVFNADTNKKQMFWDALPDHDKNVKGFEGPAEDRKPPQEKNQEANHPKKLLHLFTPRHVNKPPEFNFTDLSQSGVAPPPPVPDPSPSQHSVNIHLTLDPSSVPPGSGGPSSLPPFPQQLGTDECIATQDLYQESRKAFVDPETLDKLRARTLEYNQELQLMWTHVKQAEGDFYSNEHIAKEGNVFHCHICNQQLVSPYDVVLHVYGDDHLRDIGAYACAVQ